MERFSRIIQVIGEDSFQKLQKAHITIFGLGAVGAWAAEMLARSGIGRFTLVDFDQIAKTNINRHVCAAESTIGIPKVEAVKNRILDINPRAEVKALKLFADYTNREEILDENPDIVIDAIDSLGPKASLLEAIHRRGLLAISSMGAAHRFDLGPGEELVVDNGHLLAWDEGMEYTMQKASGFVSSVTSGEGLVCKFRGPGTLYIHTVKYGF